MREVHLPSVGVANWVELLRARAQQHPDRLAFTFLRDGEVESARLTYGDLGRQACALAASWQRRGAQPGDRVLLLHPPGVDFILAFFGCLLAGLVAVPSYPPRLGGRKRKTDTRLESIACDARPQWVSSSAELYASRQALSAGIPELAAAGWLAMSESMAADAVSGWVDPRPTGESVALLQYTSGSTSTPKGVVVTHGNLLCNEETIRRAFAQSSESVIVGWLPLYHDMGLIGNVLQPVYVGAHSILMSPMAFLLRPQRWLMAISHYRATTSGGPNFAYDLCVRKIRPADREQLDLSSWQVAFNGSEPVRAQTLERFTEAFAPQGFARRAFFPCYGLAEATLFVSGGSPREAPVVETFDAAALEGGRALSPAANETESAADETESAVSATAEPPIAPSRHLVGSGRTWPGQRLRIVDPETCLECSPGRIGEIWLAGPSVARGYWRRPEETERDYDAHLADSRRGPFLRTGDLGFLHGEELFVTGRLKDLIILRGRNHYPQDFERTAEACHADLQPGGSAAVAVDAPAGERLVLILELERRRQARVDIEEVVGAVRQAIAEEHQAQVHDVVLIRAGTLPRTSSGKVRRRACAAAYVAGELAVVGSSGVSGERETAPALVFERAAFEALDPMARERWILDFLCQRVVAAAGLDPSRLDPQQPLTAAGFDSLMTVELANDLQTTLRVGLPLDQLLADKSLAELSRDLIARLAEDDTEASIDSIPSQTVEGLDLEAPLSHGQQALWLLQRLAPDSAAYHVTFAARLRGPVDSGALRRVAEGWLARHPGLRATFHLRDGQPYQRFDAGLDFAAVDAALWSRRQLDEGLLTEAERPFDLGAGPLLRLHLFRRAVGEIVMLLVVHHAVADFGSLQKLLVELAETYASQAADPTGDQTPAVSPPPPLHYADYVRWQQNRVSGPHGERMWRYWESALADAETVLELPTDRPRPPTLSYRGAGLPYRVEEEAAKRLETLGRQHGATPYMVLLAVFQVLLGRTTGRQDLLVGSPLAGRGHRDLAQLVGYLVNPLPIRGDLRSGSQPRTPTFVEVLDRLRHRVAGALAHQDYPAPLLVEQLAPEREANRNPLFQVLFTLEQPRGELGDDFAGFMLGQVGSRMALGGLEMESVALERRWSQFDLALRLVRSGTQLVGEWIFSTDLFDAVTLARMAEHYSQLLATFSAQPQQRIGDASLLPRAERHQLVCEWNAGGFDPGAQGTTIGVPGTQSTLDRLIAAQAAATPEGVALVVGDARLSYAELDARAGALARRLEAHGVGPDALVGIFLERNAWLPIAILGTLRAGAAYVPLDPVYPRQRLRFVIEDTRAPVVLTQSSLLDRLPEGDARALCLDRSGGAATDSGLPADRSAVASGPDDLAYVIYTSGSTGRPKGVAITHRSAVRLLAWARRQYSREQTAGLLAATSVCFDLSIFELFLPLVRGGKVILADSAFHLRALPAAGEVTLVNTVPSAITELARQSALPATVRTVNLAGEALHQSVVDATYDAGGVDAVYNLYGPSEDTTYSTWERVSPRAATSPSIGRPVDGTRAYLLDRQGRTVPVGVAGEIFLGGAGLARGYLGRPGATAARFLPDPFSDRTGSRLYQTGDSGRLRGDGRIDFLGRIDHQIKLRGFRIELGEIEAALSHQPGVEETVVVVRRTAGVDRLVAYIASQQTPPPSTADLTQALRRGLPDYMVPSIVVLLPELPRLPNGKIDRQHLPEPATQRPQLAASFVAPSTELGRQLAAIWQEVLGLDQVGLDDSFFELGGHSLLMAQVHDRLEKLVDRPIPIVELFQFPTLRALEKHLGGAAEAPPSFDAVRQRAARKRRLAPARRSRRSRSRPSR